MNPQTGDGHTLLCSGAFRAEYAEELQRIAPGLRYVEFADHELHEEQRDLATISFMSGDLWPDKALAFLNEVRSAKNMRWFHILTAGVDNPIFDSLFDRGVRVTRSAGTSANAIAETVFMFLHGLSRDLKSAGGAHAERRYAWHRWHELEGRNMAVVGFGPIGQRIAALGQAYGMHVTAVRRDVRGDEPCDVARLQDLEQVVRKHDVVVLALPLNDDTQGIVSRAVIGAMSEETLFINVARGGLVDQGALFGALAEGKIAGAGLDVFDVEPLPADDPLWDLPNVLVTPHNSAASFGTPKKVAELFLRNLEGFLAGQQLEGEVHR